MQNADFDSLIFSVQLSEDEMCTAVWDNVEVTGGDEVVG